MSTDRVWVLVRDDASDDVVVTTTRERALLAAVEYAEQACLSDSDEWRDARFEVTSNGRIVEVSYALPASADPPREGLYASFDLSEQEVLS